MLTLKVIMQAFINAEDKYPRHAQKSIFSLSDSFSRRTNSTYKIYKAEQIAFFNFWVPESFANCFGKAGNELSDDQIRHISAGRKKKVTESLKSQFENNAVQMFWNYQEHIEKALERHIKVYVWAKNKGPSIFDGENVRVSNSELVEEIKTKVEEYENTLKAFKKEMLESILKSAEYLCDERITKSMFYGLLADEKRDEIERLTILSIFGLFATVTIENEEYYCIRAYKKLYDEDTNELRQPPKKEDAPIRIDRVAIWEAGKKWYEQSRTEGNRFSQLFPDTKLLPLAGTIPIYVHSIDNQEKPLMDMIRETPGHLYLIGEGGIGKTTALYSIMEDAYVSREEQSNRQVPLFIELSRAYQSKDFDLDRGESKFIRHTVQNQLQNFLKTKTELGIQIEEEFEKDTDEPEYILLLDGLNEVSREEIQEHVILRMVVAEIVYIMANYKNVKVILTSRSAEKLNEAATSLYLSGIKPEQIEIYLKEKKVSISRINRTLANTQLTEILHIPLFLIMFAELKGDEEFLSRGEILHAFFSWRNNDRYSERNRIETINSEYIKETGIDRSEGSKDCITPHMLNFILGFVMPQIAWNMAKRNEFQITRTEIKKAIKHVLTDKTETSILSEYGIDIYSDYLTGEDENIRTTAAKIKKIFGSDGSEEWDSISSGVLKCLTKQFGLLVTNDYKEYEVIHQHIRDYFAALYHINKLKLASYINGEGNKKLAIECLSEWSAEPLPGHVLVFIGEALGEMHNVPVFNETNKEWDKREPRRGTERDLINRSFDIFRGFYNDKYAVWNLFQIIKLVREDISGVDLSDLDLRKCRANGYRLGNKTFAANIENALLTDEFFLPTGHANALLTAIYSPDGNYILTASGDGTAKVWDAKSFNTVFDEVLEGATQIQYSHDGKYCVTVSSNSIVKVWDAKTFKEIPGGVLIGHKWTVNSVCFSPDGQYILTCSNDGEIRVWNAKTFKETQVKKFNTYEGILRSAQYSPDGKYILLSSWEGTIKLWDAHTFEEIPGKVNKTGHSINSVQYSPDGKHIVISTTITDRVQIWDAEDLNEVPGGVLVGHNSNVYTAHYSPDGKYIVTASQDGTARVWDAKTFKGIPGGILKGHKAAVISAQYSPDGKYILTASDDGSAKVWDANTFNEIPGGELFRNTGIVYSAEYSPDGKHIVTASRDGTAKVWDAKTFKEIPEGILKGHLDAVFSARYSPDGEYIVTASEDGTAKVWDAKSFKEITGGLLKGHKKAVNSACYSPDGKYIVTASDDGTAKIWDTESYTEVLHGLLDEQGAQVYTACYSPDGNFILTAVKDGMASVWDAKTYSRIPKGKIKRPQGGRASAKYSPDGNYIVTVFDKKAARIWSAKTFTNVPNGVLTYKNRETVFAQYSPDGKYIVTTARDGKVKIWNAKSFKEIPNGTLDGHRKTVYTALFSPDMKSIVTASADEKIKIWDANTFNEIYTINNVPGIEVWNVDIRKLNELSCISDDTIRILHDYGAIT